MPSTYAHYRFGAELLTRLPPELRRSAVRFRQLYDMGLHGPDLFYYESPLGKGALGAKFHAQTGKAFFERVCRSMKLNPSEGATAYLCGVLAHYALDSLSHPFIHRMAAEGKGTHTQIEVEFDRYLLEKDGKSPAYLHDPSEHMHLTPGECETAAAFYPGVRAGTVQRCVKNMALSARMLAVPQGTRRKALGNALTLAGRERGGMLMPVHPNRVREELDPSLLRLYEMAMDRYPVLLDQIQTHLRRNTPLGPDFSAVFR